MLAGLQVSHQTEYPGPATPGGVNRWYTGNGGYSNNCPISTCDTTVCPLGKYLSGCGGTSAGNCDSSCTNAIPTFSVYSSNGGTSATGCSWECAVNFELNLAGTGCVQKTCAANYKESKPFSSFLASDQGSYPFCKYQCNAGYIGNGTIIPDGRGPAACIICQAGTAAAAGAASCTDCGPGLYSASAGSATCSICYANDLKYSLGTRNTGCSDCTLCAAAGSFKNSCGGASAGGCDPCTNSRYTPP